MLLKPVWINFLCKLARRGLHLLEHNDEWAVQRAAA